MKYLLLLVLFSLSCTTIIKPSSMDEFRQISVMVHNQRSSGSGVIFQSSDEGTTLLTNSHICKAPKLQIVFQGKLYNAIGINYSKVHDICAIFITENLGINTTLATKPPKIGSKVCISGFPSSYPHILSCGYVAGLSNSGIANSSFRDYLVTTALISPGSSGSPVFNERGELVGLAFAVMGPLGYGLVVPYQHLKYFLEVEIFQTPK